MHHRGDAAYLRLVHGWDDCPHLIGAPGERSQVMALSAEYGADLREIAIVQTMRVVIIAVGLPAGLSLFGLVGHATRVSAAHSIPRELDELAILVAVSTASRSSPIASAFRAVCCSAPWSPRRSCTAPG